MPSAGVAKTGSSIVLDYAPYLTSGSTGDWRAADATFRRDLKAFGLAFASRREDLFFERDHFFDTDLHLNATGRTIRTMRLIEALKAQGLANPATSPTAP